jgi:ATP synthase protein I
MLFPSQGKPSGALELLSTAGTIGLDKWLGTEPWLLVIFLLLGIVAGFRDVYREAQRMQRKADNSAEGSDGPKR